MVKKKNIFSVLTKMSLLFRKLNKSNFVSHLICDCIFAINKMRHKPKTTNRKQLEDLIENFILTMFASSNVSLAHLQVRKLKWICCFRQCRTSYIYEGGQHNRTLNDFWKYNRNSSVSCLLHLVAFCQVQAHFNCACAIVHIIWIHSRYDPYTE